MAFITLFLLPLFCVVYFSGLIVEQRPQAVAGRTQWRVEKIHSCISVVAVLPLAPAPTMAVSFQIWRRLPLVDGLNRGRGLSPLCLRPTNGRPMERHFHEKPSEQQVEINIRIKSNQIPTSGGDETLSN